MSTPEKKIDSVYDFTDKGLVELKAWLEPWLLDRGGGAVEWEDVGVDCSGSIYGSYEEVLRLTGGLIGYWKLDDALDFGGSFTATSDFHDNISLEVQADVVADSSGLGNHFSYFRQDTDTPRQDITLAAGYVDLPGGASLQAFEWVYPGASHGACFRTAAWAGLGTVMSVSFWFKTPASGTPAGWMLGTHEVEPTGGGGLGINKGWAATLGFGGTFPGASDTSTAGQIEVWHSDGAASITSPQLALTGPAVANDTWYHVAITSDGTTNTLYVNGINVDTFTAVGNILSTYQERLKFGMQGYKSGVAQLGAFATAVTLDEVAAWTATVSEYHAGLQAHG